MTAWTGRHLTVKVPCLAVLHFDGTNLAPIWIVRLTGLFYWPLIPWLRPIRLVDWMKYAAGRLDRTWRIGRLWLWLCFDARWTAMFSDPEIDYSANLAVTPKRITVER